MIFLFATCITQPSHCPDYLAQTPKEKRKLSKRTLLAAALIVLLIPLTLFVGVTYELELIHPFADGNGRIGRLWHTLLLTQWKPLFAWLPVESIIHDRQDEYYSAINRSNAEGESMAFIVFMLSAIKEALLETVQTSGTIKGMTTDELRWHQVERFLKKHDIITNAEVRQLFRVSAATANRILAKLAEDGKIQKIRIGRSWGYVLVDE